MEKTCRKPLEKEYCRTRLPRTNHLRDSTHPIPPDAMSGRISPASFAMFSVTTSLVFSVAICVPAPCRGIWRVVCSNTSGIWNREEEGINPCTGIFYTTGPVRPEVYWRRWHPMSVRTAGFSSGRLLTMSHGVYGNLIPVPCAGSALGVAVRWIRHSLIQPPTINLNKLCLYHHQHTQPNRNSSPPCASSAITPTPGLPCSTRQHTGRTFFRRRAKRVLSSADSSSRVLCLDRRMGLMASLWRRFWMVYFQCQATASSSTVRFRRRIEETISG